MPKMLDLLSENPGLAAFYWAGWAALVLIWISCLAVAYRKGEPRFVLFGVVVTGVMAVLLVMIPLKRFYGLSVIGADGFSYLAHAMSIAEGNPVLDDFALSGVPTAYSPVFPALIAFAHWVTDVSVSTLYNYAPLIMVVLIPLSLCAYGKALGDKSNYLWLGGLMAFCFMFLAQDPRLYFANTDGFWDVLMLYKPGHVLAFVCQPLLYYFLTRKPHSRKMLFLNFTVCGVVLALTISVYIPLAAFVIAGLVLFPILTYFLRKEEALMAVRNVLIVILLGFLFSSWYWLRALIFSGFDMSLQYDAPLKFLASSSTVFDPFEATFFMTPLFWLGLVGIVTLLHQRKAAGLLLVSYIFAMYTAKIIAPFTWVLLDLAPQAWEVSLFGIRTGMAMAAGVGLFSIAKFLASHHDTIVDGVRRLSLYPALRLPGRPLRALAAGSHQTPLAAWACLLLLVLTPYMTPVWYFPSNNIRVQAALEPIPAEIQTYAQWIRDNTEHDAVFLCDGDTSEWVGATTGRKMMVDRKGRSLLGNFAVRKEDATTVYNSDSIEEITPILKQYDVSYVMITQDTLEEYPDIAPAKFYDESHFDVAYSEGSTTIFGVK
jgi:hypothetical protein